MDSAIYDLPVAQMHSAILTCICLRAGCLLVKVA
jgi:hypothetical protein